MKQLSEALFSRRNIKRGNPYGLKEDDLKGDIEGFPMGIVVRMLEEQEHQGNKPDVKVFQGVRYSCYDDGGFDWDCTEARYSFWRYVIEDENWKMFFELYPKYERYNLS